MHFGENIQFATDTYLDDGLVLLPTDSTWCVSCRLLSTKAFALLKRFKIGSQHIPLSLLVKDLKMLKAFFTNLHPRIETLLLHFERPLSISLPFNESLPDFLKEFEANLSIRLSHDPFCNSIIEHLGEPLLVVPALDDQQLIPNSFQTINSETIRSMSYICLHRSNDLGFSLESLVTYDEVGNLEFISP